MGLLLNYFGIKLNNSSISVLMGKYESEDQVAKIQNICADIETWIFEDNIYAWTKTTHLPKIKGMNTVSFTLQQNPILFKKVIIRTIEHRLFRNNFERDAGGYVNYSVEGGGYLKKSNIQIGNNEVGIYPKILTSVFFTETLNNDIIIGAVIDVVYRNKIDVSLKEWVESGVPARHIEGQYVKLMPTPDNLVKHPDLVGRSIGRVVSISEDNCLLDDPKVSSITSLPLSEVSPEPRGPNIDLYLSHIYSSAYKRNKNELANKLQALLSPSGRLRASNIVVRDRIHDRIPNDVLRATPTLTFKIGSMASLGGTSFPFRRLRLPQFNMDAANNTIVSGRLDQAIKEHGPFDSFETRRKHMRILVLGLKENEGTIKASMHKLINGVNTNRSVFSGLKSMYRLHNIEVYYSLADKNAGTSPMERFSVAFDSAMSDETVHLLPSGAKYSIVVPFILHDYRFMPTSENPYYQVKILGLLHQGVPTQSITIEKMRAKDYALQYILNNIGLAVYAKLGGTPFVLQRPIEGEDQPIELIFGLGQAIDESSRYKRRRKVIGFASIFQGNGEYLHNEYTPFSDETSYEHRLEEMIERGVRQIARQYLLAEGSALRLIFHIPRTTGTRDVTPIINAINKLVEFEIKFALLHLNSDSNFKIYDDMYKGSRSKNFSDSHIPQRGLCIRLGPRERLVTFIGPQQYKDKGLPTPLRITIDERSTYEDLDSLSEQIYQMSFMSMKSLMPGTEPVTLTYSRCMADLIKHFKETQNWIASLTHQKLGRIPWFI